MRKFLLLFPVLALTSLLFVSCDLLGLGDKEETDPDKTVGKVGNYWDASAAGYDDAQLTIDENNNGDVVATVSLEGQTYTIEGKITDNTISDYVYSGGDKSKPFTLVKFDAKVGDKWTFNVGNKTVTREVVRKSTEDDVEFGFWLVKTIDVEETVPTGTTVNGSALPYKKILWKFNHKFGFITATVTKNDNSEVDLSVYTNAGD